MRLIRITPILVLMFWSLGTRAQNITNKGTDFWVGYGHHQFMENPTNNSQDMVLYLSAEEKPATVTVTIDSSGPLAAMWWKKTYYVPAYTVIKTAIIPKGTVDAPTPADANYDARLITDAPPANTGGAGHFRKRGIHIQSDVPIVAYAHIYGSMSSGATMLLPTEAWGQTYVSVNSKQSYGKDCYNWMYVIANRDNTVIEITPTVLTRAQNITGLRPGVTSRVTLMKGQIYQVIGANDGADADGNFGEASTGKDLTGTKVRSIAGPNGDCYPIAVFAGSSRTSNPASCGSGGGDNDNQQLFPQHAWGKRYLTTPFSGSSTPSSFAKSTYKVAVKDPNTIVKRNGQQLSGWNPDGNFYVFESNTADYIEADQPILVVQFMTGGGCLGAGGLGDPEMVVLSPIEQAIKHVAFFRNNNESLSVNYLTLSVPTAGLASLRINNSSSFSYTYPHPNLAGYTVVVQRWSSPLPPAAPLGQCIVDCDSAFNAITYGLGSMESYAYSAGANINNLNAVADIHNLPDTSNGGKNSHLFNCVGTPTKLSVLMRYQPIKQTWKLSSLSSVLTPSADVTLDPASQYYIDTVIVKGIKYYKYTLPGTYTFNAPGTYNIPIESMGLTVENCNNTETLKISVEVRPTPNVDFSFTHGGCTKDTVYFKGPNSALEGANTYTINQWVWTFPGGVLGSARDTGVIIAPGTHDIKLYGATSDGCAAEKTKPITVFAAPTATLGATPTAVCLGQDITLSSTSAYTGPTPITTWYWDLGNEQVINAANGNNVIAKYTRADSFRIKHVVKVSDLCVSDTVEQVVKVSPEAIVEFSYPTGCLDASGVAQFSAGATDINGQPITSYNWSFGDPNATSSNPNSSTERNPSHTYTAYGTYPISLDVVTNTGCTGDTTINVAFALPPALEYGALNAMCANGNPVSVARVVVTNNVPGTGVYKGPGTNAAGMFDPAAAGPGTHTIWYVFATTGGCMDSVSQTIEVNPEPVISSIEYDKGCLPADGKLQFTQTSTDADGQALTYLWDFDDANATAANPATSTMQNPEHIYRSGAYDVSLTVTSAKGCATDTTIALNLKVRAQLSYPALSAVCESNTAVSVATASVGNGEQGVGMYKGPGISSAGQFTAASAGPGTHTLWYVFTTNGGCADSASQTITVYPKPSSSFTMESDVCLGNEVTITDGSSISLGSISSWTWNFSDAANPVTYNNNASFTRTFATDGSYLVKLTTTSDQGCKSDVLTKTVTVHPLPLADFDLPVAVCMPGGSAVFTNRSRVGGNGTLTYQWNFGDGATGSSTGNATHVYGAAGSYAVQLTATSAFGCVGDTTKVLSAFYDKPVAAFDVAPDVLCQGERNEFTDRSSAPNSTVAGWRWDFADGTTSTEADPVKKYAQPGNYNVQLVVANAVGCESDPFNKNLTVYLQPVIDAGPSFVVPQGTVIRFNPKVNDSTSVSFIWDPATGLSDPAALRPTMTAIQDGTFTLTATGENDCTATDFITVKILKPVKIPNAFSPNGDGINDTWEVTNLSDYPGATVEVFNRYGQPVFYSNGYGQPWDGKLKGNHLPVATYYYIITLKNGFKPVTGSVTIIR